MRQTDRFLLALVAGVVLLVGAALTIALTRPAQSFLPETSPSNVAHNYVLAIKQLDDARAYGYLSTELTGYPASLDKFSADMSRYGWSFSRDSATIATVDERIAGERAVVTLNETRFYEGGLFSSNQYTSSFNITLRREGDAWKVIGADSYWVACWSEQQPCE